MRNRHEIREAAFQSLFALNANPEADHAAVYADVLAPGEEVPDYLMELVDGVLAHQAELDEAISAKLKKRLDAESPDEDGPDRIAPRLVRDSIRNGDARQGGDQRSLGNRQDI